MPVIDVFVDTFTKPAQPRSFAQAVLAFLLEFRDTAFSTYRPEAHYMRGPGPACDAKRTHARRAIG